MRTEMEPIEAGEKIIREMMGEETARQQLRARWPVREWFGLARGCAYRCRRTIAIAAIMPKGIRMKSAMREPIAKPLASGERPGGTATNRVSQSSSFMVFSKLRIQYIEIAAVTD
jgi:hypothetical protein